MLKLLQQHFDLDYTKAKSVKTYKFAVLKTIETLIKKKWNKHICNGSNSK